MNPEKFELECIISRLKSCELKPAALLFLIVTSLLGDLVLHDYGVEYCFVNSEDAPRYVDKAGDEENSAKDVATAEEALKVVLGVVKATSDEIYSDKSKEAAQVLLTELM